MRWLHQAVLPVTIMALSTGAAGAAMIGHTLPTEYYLVLTGAWGAFVGHRIGSRRGTDARTDRVSVLDP